MLHFTVSRPALGAAIVPGALALIAVLGVMGRFVERHSLRAHAQGAGGCSVASFAGSYGYAISGTLFLGEDGRPQANGSTRVDLVEIGVAVYDGQGGVTITSDSASTNGQPTQRTGNGTYTVNPDCTGATTLFFSNSPVPIQTVFVLVDGGNESHFVATGTGVDLSGIGKRQ